MARNAEDSHALMSTDRTANTKVTFYKGGANRTGFPSHWGGGCREPITYKVYGRELLSCLFPPPCSIALLRVYELPGSLCDIGADVAARQDPAEAY